MPGARNPQTFNRYSYVLNSPLNLIDPTGNVSCSLLEPEAAAALPSCSSGGGSTSGGSSNGGSSGGGTTGGNIGSDIGNGVIDSPNGPTVTQAVAAANTTGLSTDGHGNVTVRTPLLSEGATLTAEEFQRMSYDQRAEWLEDFQNNVLPSATTANMYNGIGAVIDGFGSNFPNNALFSSADAGVLQQIQNGWLRYNGQDIVCTSTIGFQACSDSADLWASFLSESLQGDLSAPRLNRLYSIAEGEGAEYGKEFAFASTSPGSRDHNEFRVVWFGVELYRIGQTVPVLNQAPLLQPASYSAPYGALNYTGFYFDMAYLAVGLTPNRPPTSHFPQ